jgi:ankyrin repeat protein
MRDGELQVERILTKPSSPLTAFGDCVATFDWLMRTHPLGERIPLSVDEAGAQLLEQAPTSGFSLFGRQLFCAAIHFPYPPSRGQLCSDGAVVAAIQRGETEALAQLIAAGASATAPSTMGGYLPLHLALHFKHAHMVDLLLRHGADVNQATRKGVTPLLVAVSAGSDPTQLALLLRRGADLEAGDQKGFRPLHEAAQHDHHDIVRWLIAQGAQCEARTAQGFTPLQIACALGSLRAAKALHAAGANIRADSPAGSALAIAQQQGQTEIYEWLRRLL